MNTIAFIERRFDDMTVAEIVAVLVAEEREFGVNVVVGQIDPGPKVSVDFQYQTVADAVATLADQFGYTLSVTMVPIKRFTINLRK